MLLGCTLWPQPTVVFILPLIALIMHIIRRPPNTHVATESLRRPPQEPMPIVWDVIKIAILAIAYGVYGVGTDEKEYVRRTRLSRMLETWWRGFGNRAFDACNVVERWLSRRHTRHRITKALSRHRSLNRSSLIIMSALAMQGCVKAVERTVAFDTDSASVGVDNRCSGCISHVKTDFVGPLAPSNRIIKGFGGSRTVNVQVGTLLWHWDDDDGCRHMFEIPNSYCVPDGGMRLLSPQHWAQAQSPNRKQRAQCGEHTNGNECVLYWNDGESKLHIRLGQRDNVATFPLAHGYSQFHAFCCEAGLGDSTCKTLATHSSLISDDEEEAVEVSEPTIPPSWTAAWSPPADDPPRNTEAFALNGPSSTPSTGEKSDSTLTNQHPNIIEDEENRQPQTEMAELLSVQHKYGHIPMRKLQEMARQGTLPRRLAKCNIPTCSARLYAKATKKPWRGKTTKRSGDAEQVTKPGAVVSVDQLVSPTPGLIAQMTGFLTTKRYKYATVFVDQFSRLGYVHLQKTTSGEETVEAKKAFELYAQQQGVQVENYLANNGISKANLWVEACKAMNQRLTFAGVNAHHLNGVVERRIRELRDLARSMLIHANSRWPDAITANLWPYAIRMASEAINHTPSFQDSDRRSPMEIFTGLKVVANPKHWQPFGCPVYVLESELQSGQPFHKWKHRSRVGIYIGKSPQHGRNVALVLSMETGLVSPQFHVAYDPSFQTVAKTTLKSKWQLKAGFVTQRERPGTTKTSKPGKEQNANQKVKTPEGGQAPRSSRKRKRREGRHMDVTGIPESLREREPAAANVGSDGSPTSTSGREKPNEEDKGPRVQVTRSSRKTKPPSKFLTDAMVAEVQNLTSGDVAGEIYCVQAMFPDDQFEYANPLHAYKAVSDPDTLYYHEVMKEPDRKEFQSAMSKEVNDQFENGNFTVVPRSKVPEGHVILPAVWQMRRKRDVRSGAIKKYKARLNIDGSRMKHGVRFDETYSPVASWNSVRMLLTLTAVHGWHTKQIDFVQAFAQALVEKMLYMKVPAGMELENGADPREYALKIHRNMYGQKQAGRVWNKYLVDRLVNKLGFQQSKVDECVFYRGRTLYVLYTDDSLLAGPDEKEINQVIDNLRKVGKLDITVKGDLADFLGVNIDRKKDGSIHLTQPHLIDHLRLKDDRVKAKSTPAASSKLLTRHRDSEAFDGSFNYRSVIGKLNYLEKATRSDISYAVHQCARFVSDPKREHGDAVRWLGRYLKGTMDKGTIMRPMSDRDLEVHVGASFCGDWDPKEAAVDRDTARSRHGYVISYAGCPLLWKSQVQTEIALSTTESKYTGLSYALRDAIPIIELLKEMKAQRYPIATATAKVHCRVFEDNSGALEMAKNHKYRPRTKHLNIKLHHFQDYVERKEISIHAIPTAEQPADFLTKALSEDLSVKHRRTVMGW